MNKALGIVAEYNPFHNGHKYQINKALELSGAQVLICAISGNITQRGEFALLDKWKRAEIAVRNGVNLVVEIPAIYACNNAGYFAKAGVEILENLGVDHISFGVEGNENELIQISNYLKNNYLEIENEINSYIKDGYSYPKAREEVLKEKLGEDITKNLRYPNDILAIEYLKYMKKSKPIFVKRQSVGYHSNDIISDFASASKIRDMILNKEDYEHLVPKETYNYLTDIDYKLFNSSDKMFNLIINRIMSLESDSVDLNKFFGLEEGLGNIILKKYRAWNKYEDIIESLKSKRYTETRINRCLTNMLLGITKEKINSGGNYIRILAFDEVGAKYLKDIKKNEVSNLPIITNINKDVESLDNIEQLIDIDIKASDLYNLSLNLDLYSNSEYVKKPFIL